MVHAHLAEAQHPAQLHGLRSAAENLPRLDRTLPAQTTRVLLSTAGRGCLSTSMGDTELEGTAETLAARGCETDRGA